MRSAARIYWLFHAPACSEDNKGNCNGVTHGFSQFDSVIPAGVFNFGGIPRDFDAL